MPTEKQNQTKAGKDKTKETLQQHKDTTERTPKEITHDGKTTQERK